MHIAPEVDFDIGGSDFLEVVSFREENVLLFEFDSVETLDLHDNLMFANPTEDLISSSREFECEGRIMQFLRDFVSCTQEMAPIVFLFLLSFFFSFNKIRCGETCEFFGDEVVSCIGMTDLDNLALFSHIGDALEELYRNLIVGHSFLFYELFCCFCFRYFLCFKNNFVSE